ncbi:Fungalysin metallopeptidase-domain-containing protein [Crepidotus variabilis]|uniref:Extracellular metalloproteinase n=1 Tax=Crepidotus variabilis TaxID=179855 RepID=A0A9P6EF79_9AGAR|nr:Fungalysin metallopeptidase-domain-containing protein [Crepidotus variabilis]
MAAFQKLLVAALLAISYTSAFPATGQRAERHATRREVTVGTTKIDAYHPPSSLETFSGGIESPSSRTTSSLGDSAKAFVASRLSKSSGEVTFRSGYSGDVAEHAYLTQTHDNIPFANAVANVAFKDKKVVSFGHSFVTPKSINPSTPSVSVGDAITTAEKTLGGKYNNYPTKVEYYLTSDGTAVLTHVIQVQNDATGAWFEAFVNAHSGDLVSVVDFVADASYRVIPIQKQDPTEGFETLTDPQDSVSSPSGWHSTGTTNSTTTAGNNAVSYKSSQSSVTSQSSATLNFVYNFDATKAPATSPNLDVARTNAFYVVNTIHDLTYRYGFTEAAYNFQTNNFGKGGSANDRVLVSVQDSSGTDNANFATPADGQSGQMRMFLWDYTSPGRDGAIENDIVTHEMTHGVSNRLTGGGTGRCLQTTEAGGMGEGWSDTMALYLNWTEQKSSATPDFTLGSYVINNKAGIRSHPYSTSTTTNPYRYSTLKTKTEVHDIGEVWANTLFNVYAALVQARGWSATARTNPTGTEGNIVFLHLFIDSLAIQPCNPTFLTARDAWIQADVNRYAGANKCTLWKAFASRGLGVNAANHNDDTTVPTGC